MKPESAVKCYLITGSILIIVCAIFAGIFGVIFTSILENIMVIKENGSIYDSFVSPDVPIYMDFFIFNVTNPEEVQNYGAKAILNEIGPYRYLETYEKHDVNFTDDDNFVSYVQDTTYYFDREQSIGPESDAFVTINPVMVVAAALLYNHKLASEIIWPEIEEGMDLFEKHTVGEMTYGGWDMPMYDFDFSNIPLDIFNKTEGLQGSLYDLLVKIGITIDFLEPNKIGIFYGTNGTNDGVYKVKTGNSGMDDYLYIEEWKGNDQLTFWNTEYCNMINGTDGSQFPPGRNREDPLPLYISDLCRSMTVEYETDVKVRDLISAYKFIAPDMLFAAPDINPDNGCYCRIPYPTDTLEECDAINGMINLANCYKGVPVVLSCPHFFMGDQQDVDNFVGLTPNKDLHETYLDIEPTTGLVVEAARRIQVNVPLRNYGNLPSFRNVREVIFPIFWADENFLLPEDDSNTLHKALTLPFIVVYSVCGVLILLGIALVAVGLVKRSKNKKEPKFGKLGKN